MEVNEFADSFFRKPEQFIQLGTRIGGFLTGRLDFHELSGSGHYDIGVNGGVSVLGVVEIENATVVVDSRAYGGQMVEDGVFRKFSILKERIDRYSGG